MAWMTRHIKAFCWETSHNDFSYAVHFCLTDTSVAFCLFCSVYQSGFRKHYAKEVFKDLWMTVDAGDSAMLVLLDLTADFDTIYHTVLLSWLEEYVGIQGKALSHI